MNSYDCRTIVFSSSATVYEQSDKLLDETTRIDPINPYGRTKVVVEELLKDLFLTPNQNWKIINLRYFNPIGAHSSGLIGEDPKSVSTNIFPLITGVSSGKIQELKVFGNDWETRDGTCIRDYIHVMDLAEGHVAMIKNNRMKKGLKIYNFGTGKGSSVMEVIKLLEKQTGITISFKFTKRRKGDVSASFCSPKKAYKELNWRHKYSLKQAMMDIKKIL